MIIIKKCPKCQKDSFFLSNNESVMRFIPNTYCIECTIKIIGDFKATKICQFCREERDIFEFSIGLEKIRSRSGIDELLNVKKKFNYAAFCNECYKKNKESRWYWT